MNAIAFFLLIPAMFFSALASLFFKKGAKFLTLKKIINKNLIKGVFLYILSTIFYVLSLKNGDLSIIYPLSSLNYIFIIFLSKRYLNEKINKYKFIGIFMIIIGSIFVVL